MGGGGASVAGVAGLQGRAGKGRQQGCRGGAQGCAGGPAGRGGGCSGSLRLWGSPGRGGGEAGACARGAQRAHLATVSPGGRPHEDRAVRRRRPQNGRELQVGSRRRFCSSARPGAVKTCGCRNGSGGRGATCPQSRCAALLLSPFPESCGRAAPRSPGEGRPAGRRRAPVPLCSPCGASRRLGALGKGRPFRAGPRGSPGTDCRMPRWASHRRGRDGCSLFSGKGNTAPAPRSPPLPSSLLSSCPPQVQKAHKSVFRWRRGGVAAG